MTYPHPHPHHNHQLQQKKRFALLWEYPNGTIIRHYGAATKSELGELLHFTMSNDRRLMILKMNKFSTGFLYKVFSESTILSGHLLLVSVSGKGCPIVRICIATSADLSTYKIIYLSVLCTVGEIFDCKRAIGVVSFDKQTTVVEPNVRLGQLHRFMSYSLNGFHSNFLVEDDHITMPTLYLFGSPLELPLIDPSRYASFPMCLGIGSRIDPDVIPFPRERSNFGNNYNYRRPPVSPRGVIGLSNNNGIMCYVNSVTQCLAHTTLFKTFCTTGLFKEGINRSNPLGTRGQLAQSFGALICKLWDYQYGTVPSTGLWKAMGSFKCCFEEYQQQDAQEFLAGILDGLHEDYNEVTDRILVPKFEPSEATPIEDVADECWKRYLLRNRSFLVENCMGMLKSTLQCKTCGKGNLTFDPYMQLTLELPDSEPEQLVEWIYFPEDYPSVLPVQFHRVVPPFATAGDLKDITMKELKLNNLTRSDMFWVILSYRRDESSTTAATVNQFYTSPNRDSQKIFHITMEINSASTAKVDSHRHRTIGLFASRPAPSTLHRIPVVVNCLENVKTEGTLHPIVTLFSQAEMNTQSLLSEINRRTGLSEETYRVLGADWDECVQGGCTFCAVTGCEGCMIWPLPRMNQHSEFPLSFDGMGPCSSFASDSVEMERITTSLHSVVDQYLKNNSFDLDYSLTLGDQDDSDCIATVTEALSEYSSYLEHMNLNDMTVDQIINYVVSEKCAYGRESSHYFDQTPEASVEFDSFAENAPSLTTPIVVKVCWNDTRLTTKLDLNLLANAQSLKVNTENEAHKERHRELDSRVYSLTKCLELFTRVEKLEQEDMWKCTSCKREEPSRKRFEIWSLPNLLFIHIKRFAARKDCSLRLRHHVSFPLTDLDLSEYVAKRGQSTKTGCDLASPTLEAKSNGTPPSLSIGIPSDFPVFPPTGTPTKSSPSKSDQSRVQTPKYKLTGVVTHHGPDIQYGHYTSHCLHEDGFVFFFIFFLCYHFF